MHNSHKVTTHEHDYNTQHHKMAEESFLSCSLFYLQHVFFPVLPHQHILITLILLTNNSLGLIHQPLSGRNRASCGILVCLRVACLIPNQWGKMWVREVAEHCSGLVCASPYIILNVCSVYLTYSETQFSPRDQKSILLLLNPVFAVLFWGTNKIYALIR